MVLKVLVVKKGEKRVGKIKLVVVDGLVKKKRKGRRKESYVIYIYKVFKQVYFDMGIFSKVMGIMNLFVNDIFECIVIEFFCLVYYNKKLIISFCEIQIVIRLLLFGEFVKYVVSEGIKVVIKYISSK